MTIRTLILAAASLGALFAQGPVSTTAVIETIQFDGVAGPKQAAILERIGVRTGDALSVETRQRIGRELNKGEKVGQSGMTFTYKPGSRPGTAVLVISSGC
jgi:outer membrane protein assembly factor BamA